MAFIPSVIKKNVNIVLKDTDVLTNTKHPNFVSKVSIVKLNPLIAPDVNLDLLVLNLKQQRKLNVNPALIHLEEQ